MHSRIRRNIRNPVYRPTCSCLLARPMCRCQRMQACLPSARCPWLSQQKIALNKFLLKSVKDESSTFPAVPPCFADIKKSPHPYGIPTYSRQLTYALTSQNTWKSIPFPAPSAVHLIMWVRSGSQLPGLSVRPSSSLSPLHRFKVILDSINFLYLSKSVAHCQEKLIHFIVLRYEKSAVQG